MDREEGHEQHRSLNMEMLESSRYMLNSGGFSNHDHGVKSASYGDGKRKAVLEPKMTNGLVQSPTITERKITKGSRSGPLLPQNDEPSKPSSYVVSRITMLVPSLESLSLEMQRSSLIELRLLAKNDDRNRTMIANAGALLPIVFLLQSNDETIQQEATTALLNLSLNEQVREEAIKAGAVESLVGVVKEGLTSVSMENAAVALTNLAAGQENKAKIGTAGAIPPLLELLDNGSLRGKKDAAAALYTLSTIEENKRRMVRGGATRLLVNFISDDDDSDKMMDRAIAILRNLVTIEEGRVAFVAEGGINSLLYIMQEGSCRSKDLSVAIFYQLCSNSSKHRSLVLENKPLPLLMDLSSTSASDRVKGEIAELMHVLMEPRRR